MDIDAPEQYADEEMMQEVSSKQESKKPSIVHVDDAHPFELETVLSGYSGKTRILRLIHIIKLCPTLAQPAFRAVLPLLLKTRDVSLYQKVANSYSGGHGINDAHTVDLRWINDTQAKNQSERNKLEVELKTYQNNMIKESIRIAHRDLAAYYQSVGDDTAALKHYTKSREFCSSGQHIIEMCLSVLQLLIEQRNYAHLSTYVFKAEAALDLQISSEPTAPKTSGSGHQKKSGAPSPDRAIQTKLDFSSALSNLGQGSYEKAAHGFLKLGNPKDLGDWNGTVVAPGDIAVYGVLCALATFSRNGIKAQVMENEEFGNYIEQEPYARELLESYLSSKFKTVLEVLERYSVRHYLDIHLYSHVQELSNLIRDRAIVLYFQPFTSIKLPRMAAVFGLETDELEKMVVRLIQSGQIKGRVDSRNKILKAKAVDQRALLYTQILEFGKEIHATNRKVLLRMQLLQNDLVVKAPKGHQSLPALTDMITE